MDLPPNVLLDMVHSFVNVILCCQSIVPSPAIGVDGGLFLDLVQDLGL